LLLQNFLKYGKIKGKVVTLAYLSRDQDGSKNNRTKKQRIKMRNEKLNRNRTEKTKNLQKYRPTGKTQTASPEKRKHN